MSRVSPEDSGGRHFVKVNKEINQQIIRNKNEQEKL